MCSTKPEWAELTVKLGLFDMVITTIASFTIIIFMYVLIMLVLARNMIFLAKTVGASRAANENLGFDLSEMGAKTIMEISTSDLERKRLNSKKKQWLASEFMVTR